MLSQGKNKGEWSEFPLLKKLSNMGVIKTLWTKEPAFFAPSTTYYTHPVGLLKQQASIKEKEENTTLHNSVLPQQYDSTASMATHKHYVFTGKISQ